MEIQGVRAIITGATGGIGKAIAESLLYNGAAKVGLLARNPSKLAMLLSELKQGHEDDRIIPMLADIGDEETVCKVFDEYNEQVGGLDLLVNNAGVLIDGAIFAVSFKGISKYPLASWNETLQTNLTGVFICTQNAVEIMARKRVKGLIVNISSISRKGRSGQTAYSASKGGIASFTFALARELAPYRIRACAIAPGLVDTPMAQTIPEDYRNEIISHISVGRIGRPEEIAHAVKFCVENEFFNGSVLELDGGEYD